jgi:ribosomal-protein-alanine N-acetyltransferase
VYPAAPRFGPDVQQVAEEGDRVTARGNRLTGVLALLDATPNPGLELTHRGGGLSLGGPSRQDDVDPLVVDGDANATRAFGATDAVIDHGHCTCAGYGDNPTMAFFPELHAPLHDQAVTVRLAAERDIPEVLIAHQDDPLLHVSLGMQRPPSGAELGRRVEEMRSGRTSGSELSLTITRPDDDECVGQVDVVSVDPDHRRSELRGWVVPRQRRRGLASAALALVSEWLLAHGGLERVGVLVEPANEAMVCAALAAGFHDEGRLRAYLVQREHRVDVTVLSRIREDLGL